MKTTYTPYREMTRKLERLQDIRGCSVTAKQIDKSYIVISYNTPILNLCTTTGEIIFNNIYYSPTTSRIQNTIKGAFNLSDCKERLVYKMQHGDIKAKFENLKEAQKHENL